MKNHSRRGRQFTRASARIVTGPTEYLLTDVAVEKEGIRLRFNFELSPEALREVGRFGLRQWNYLWASGYGSKLYSLEREWEEGPDEVVIEEIVPGTDLPTMKEMVKGRIFLWERLGQEAEEAARKKAEERAKAKAAK